MIRSSDYNMFFNYFNKYFDYFEHDGNDTIRYKFKPHVIYLAVFYEKNTFTLFIRKLSL